MSQINTITAPEGKWLNRGDVWVKTISTYGDTSDWVVKTQADKDKWDAGHPPADPNVPSISPVDNEIASLRADVDGLITDMGGVDNRTLPLLCGQPAILFGHGAPAKEAVPDNWIQFDPASGGYDWNGKPSALGQQYLDVDANTGGLYIAVRVPKNNELKWLNV